MKSQSQILNYLQWSRERGLIWPVLTPKTRETPRFLDVCASCKTSFERNRTPHRISLLTLLPDDTDTHMTAASSQLLDKMCAATKLPQNDFGRVSLMCCKDASADLIKARFQTILEQKPSFVLVLGESSALALEAVGVSLQMGTPHDYNGTHLLLTHHPQELITQPQKKIPAWQHLQIMMTLLKN